MKKILLFFMLIISLVLVQASFDINSTSINQKYSSGDYLKGILKISFDDQEYNSYFEDSFDNKVYLYEILNLSDYQYNCSSEDCKSVYGAENPTQQKTFTLNKNDDEVVGFKFDGVIEQINSVNFSVQSTAGESKKSQLKVDILNDKVYDTANTNIGTQIIPEEYDGCFDDEKTFEKATFEIDEPYCQRIELPEAPSFMLGAWVDQVTSGDAGITMQLYTLTGTYIDECTLPKVQITSVGGLVSCRLDYLVTNPTEYYVCANMGPGTGKYRIKAYYDSDSTKVCGFQGLPSRTETNSYKISVKQLTFGSVGKFSISNELPSGDELPYIIEQYIGSEYGSLDCSETCVVPIRFSSFIDQDITVSDILIEYDKLGISGASSTDLYDITEIGAKVDSEMQDLHLDGFFRLPDDTGSFDYALSLDGEDVYSEEISIQDINIGINIKKTASGFPNQFSLIGNFSDISSFYWDFGDNDTSTTSVQDVIHTYESEGNYTMHIILTDYSGSEFEKTFDIVVSHPKEMLEDRIDILETRIGSFRSQLAKFDDIAKLKVEQYVNITEYENIINMVKEGIKSAKTQEDYDVLINMILGIDMPTNIMKTTTSKAPFFVDAGSIDLDAIYENIGGYIEEGREDIAKDAIVFWDQENLDIKISSQELSLKYDDYVQPVDGIFDISITPKTDVGDYYMYVQGWDDIEISTKDTIELEGYKAILLSSSPTTIKISGPGISLSNLPVFISPAISDLDFEATNIGEVDTKNNRLVTLLLIIIVLGMLGLLVYMFLQRWYRLKYENYLFKDRTNLYNVMVYVNNAKKNGMTNDQIKTNLRKSGWSGEQIRYIMRKYEGRRTGMYEIGLSKKDTNPQTSKPNNNVNPSTNQFRHNVQNRFNPRYKL